jgi:hypothetical protein
MNRITILCLLAVSIFSINQAAQNLRRGFYTLPFGPIVKRADHPVRFFAAIALLGVLCIASASPLIQMILGLGK